MSILIVGNVLKDVYLNLDSRTEKFEVDQSGTAWLDLSFDASEHHFYNRNSSLGGAAVSLEVLQKMNLEATISDRQISFSDDNPGAEAPTEIYRYILVSEDGVSYLSPSKFKTTNFNPPATAYNYLFIDRSAEINAKTANQIQTYLDVSPHTKLVIYARNFENPRLNSLIKRAELIFVEQSTSVSAKTYAPELAPIAFNRVDIMTHLSTYSIASATILGSFALGFPVEKSLKLACANVKNSRIDSTLLLAELEEIISRTTSTNSLELIAANLLLQSKNILEIDDPSALLDENIVKSANGIAISEEAAWQSTVNGQTVVDFLTAHRIIPGVKINQKLTSQSLADFPTKLKKYYTGGFRFAKLYATFYTLADASEEKYLFLAEFVRACQSADLVPVIELEITAPNPRRILSNLSAKLAELGVNLHAVIFETKTTL